MAVLIPAQPELLGKLLGLQAQLVSRNSQYQSTVYAQIVVWLVCDAEGWFVKDFWWSAPPPSGAFPGGFPVQPIGGIKTGVVITPTQTSTQLGTLATTMIAAITAHVGPVYVVT